MQRSAIIRNKYRYRLIRRWNKLLPLCCFVMLNPSTADATTDDPTIRSCIRLAEYNGFGGFIVVNLFAFRSTDPKRLIGRTDIIGPMNRQYVLAGMMLAEKTFFAWGSKAIAHSQARVMTTLAERLQVTPYCFGKNRDGSPKHPLFLPSNAPMVPYLSAPP